MQNFELLISNWRELNESFSKFDQISINEFNISVELVISALKSQKTIFWCGNGGSAAESSHLAAELIGRFKENRPPFSSISLNADMSVITCIANDFGYENIFSRQLRGIGKFGDVLIALSTSGESLSIINALKEANEMGISTVAFLGKGGGVSGNLAKHRIIIDSTDTARIQEMHLFLGHSLCEIVDRSFGFINS